MARPRFRAYEAITHLLTRVASDRPLVVVLDDLQWADVPSLRLLTFAAAAPRQRARPRHLPGRRDRPRPRAHRDAGPPRQGARHRAGRAAGPDRDVGRFIAGATGATASRRFISGLHRRTAGNPFFLGELVRLLGSEGLLEARLAPGWWPGR